MGWHSEYGWRSAQDVRKTMIRDHETDNLRVLAHGGSGGEFYLALEVKKTGDRFILCCLIERRDGDWWVKTIDESMEPFYYACPDKVIRAAGATSNERALEWRAGVARVKARAKRKFNTGDRVLVNGRAHTIVDPTWTKTFATVRDEQGRLWKTRIKNIEIAQG